MIPTETFPEVEVCGIVHCRHGMMKQSLDLTVAGRIQIIGDSISCQGADQALLILHIIETGTDVTTARNLCWRKVDNAVYQGYEKLLSRHQDKFSAAMNETELCFGNEFSDEPALGVDTKLENLRRAGTDNSPPLVDFGLMNSLQWFNKYLLYSAAHRGVSNLQGIWADGPTSAWNGDYHFNINLQMTYWPMYSMGISSELAPPFIEFVKQLSHFGEITAKGIYGCQGWVVHAFTDNSFDTGILGDLEWSLCTTCNFCFPLFP
jgi:alpha-L-fucosidase 2